MAVRAELAKLAPAYDWNGADWNRLTLFAAALTTSPEIAKAKAQIEAARADIRAAQIRPGPTLTLTAEYAFNPPEASPWLLGAASDVLLDAGGRRRGRIEAAEVAARAASYDYAASVWALRMAVRRALDASDTAQREAELSADLLKLRRRQLDAMQKRVAAGEASRLDLDLVRADMAAAANRKTEADAKAVAARLDIAAALGLSTDAVDFAHIAASDNTLREVAPLASEVEAAALQARTEILQAAAAYDQAEAVLRKTVAEQYPEVHLGPGYTWERGLAKLPFALTLAFPSADFGKAAIKSAELKREAAGRQLEAAVASVTANIRRADADYRASWKALSIIRQETMPTAASIAKQADLAFAAGGIDRSEWAASKAGFITAELDELTAKARVLDAEAALEDALRRPLSGPELAISAKPKGQGS